MSQRCEIATYIPFFGAISSLSYIVVTLSVATKKENLGGLARLAIIVECR